MNKLFLYCTCVFILFSCNSYNEPDKCDLLYTGKKEFVIDENTYYFSKCISSYVDEETGKEFFVFENSEKGKPCILFYEMESGEQVKKVSVYEEGANAVHGLFGHYVAGLNSIFLTCTGGHILYHINSEGEILGKYEYGITDENQPLSIYYFCSYIHQPAIMLDSLLYLPQSMIYQEMDGDAWANTPICAFMDTLNKKVTNLPLKYPILFREKTPIMSTINVGYSCEFDGKNFIYAFMKSDSLIVTSDHITANKYNAKSRYIDGVKCIPNPGNDMMSIEREGCAQAMYWHFVYDKYRDVYYRFVFFPCNLDPKDNPLDLAVVRQEFSVMVLSKDFEVIGETKFPKNKYLPKMFFIGKEGLYISENNPYSENFDENKLIFSCFSVVHK